MKTVEEIISILQTFPSQSRVMVEDKWEGTIMDVGDFTSHDGGRYWSKYQKNDSPVICLHADKTDEWHASWVEESDEAS
jgi:hypothetical protein